MHQTCHAFLQHSQWCPDLFREEFERFAKFNYAPSKKIPNDNTKTCYKFGNPNNFFELLNENTRVQNLKREATLIK